MLTFAQVLGREEPGTRSSVATCYIPGRGKIVPRNVISYTLGRGKSMLRNVINYLETIAWYSHPEIQSSCKPHQLQANIPFIGAK